MTLLSGDSLMERAENMKTYKLLPGFDPSAITSIPKLSKQFSVDLCSVDCVSYSHLDGDIVLGKQFRQDVVLRC